MKHTEIFIAIGKNLREARKKLNLTQDDIAKKIPKMDRAKLSDMENGKENYTLSKLLDVCDALNISLEDVLQNLNK